MTKRFAAIALAILMIVALIPSAFAAGTNSFTLQNTKPGYTYEVYQVATVASNGSYTAVSGVDSAVVTELAKTTSDTTASLLDALDAATNVGTSIGTFASADAETKTFTALEDGIYYVKGIGTPVASASITRNNVIVLPANNAATIDLTAKTADGTKPKAYKTFGDGTRAPKEVSSDTTITYILSADVTGTATNKLEKFIINDTMDENLSLEDVAIVSVKLDNTKIDYSKTNTGAHSFQISVADSELAKDSFYDGSKVYVTFTTNLVEGAVTKKAITNSDSLTYKFFNQNEDEGEGQSVDVITYGITVKKIDAETNAVITDSEATFALYSDEACTNLIETKQTTNGVVTFDARVTTGKYYVKETVAPTGYNLNNAVMTVNVTSTNGFTEISVADTKTVLPSTGGAGTMVFTIVGLALIIAAGVMLVVVMRKRSAK